MKIYSDGTEIWNSKDVADNTKALIFVKLDLYNEITYALHWNVPPEKVIWPSIIPYFENKGNKNQIMGDDPNDDLVILGEGKQFTVKGATGAAKSKMKGMVLDAFLKVSCGGLAEYINGEEWNKMLNNAIDRVLEDLPKNFTQTLEYIIKEIVGEIVDTFVKAGAVKVAEIVGGCLKDFVTGVVNGWIIKQNEYKKQEADIMRIHKQEYQRAIEKMNERSKTSDQGTLRKQELEYLNHANEPVCTPAPWLRLDEKGTVITPSKDPNSKDAEGDFYTSFEPKGDTTNPVYLLSQKNIDKPIKYTIHFENMSDAFGAATFVSIIDTLSSNLDLNTLEIDTAASRYKNGDFKWSLKDNILKFHYRYINLPPNKVPPEGMWQTVYSIKPKKDLKLGTKILNRASIVFDANPAIVTPTTTHIIGAPKIAASTKLLDFGSLDINKSLIDTITIYNIGEYPLTINTISGLDKPFSIISNNCSGSELLPNDSCKMLVKFQIEKSDIFIDTLKIRSNDLSDYPFQIITKGYESGVSVKELIPPSKKYYIYECAPNPFYLTTSIKYYLPVSSKVSLKVYNFCGQLLRTLVDEIETEGIKQIFWDGLTFEEESVPNGVYFIHIEANDIKNHNHKFKDVIQVIKLK
jgi:hypothetical protein